jgi:hypothetical protein
LNWIVNAGTLRTAADGLPDVFDTGGRLAINGTSTLELNESLTLDGAVASVSDFRSSLTRATDARIVLAAGKTLRMENGADATITGGFTNNSASTIVVTDNGSTLTTTGGLSLIGGASAQISSGGDVSAGGSLNIGTAGDGAVSVGSGSSLSAGGTTLLGRSGATGYLFFSNASTGRFTDILVDVSSFADTEGSLEISSGSTVTGTSLAVASTAAANTGLVRISGTDSALTLSTGATTIGAASASNGALRVESGGSFVSGTGLTMVNATGWIVISGGTCSAAGNLTLNGGQLTRDAAGAFLLAPARTFTIQAGGDATFTGAFTGSAAATINITGAGSTLTTTASGALQVRGGAALNVLGGGAVASAGALAVGTGVSGGDGAVTVSSAGSSLNVAGLTTLGLNGNTGSLTFSNGSTGTLGGIDVDDSTLPNTAGSLSIQSGSIVTGTSLAIAPNAAANTGEVRIAGAGSWLTLTSTTATTIGAASASTGTLAVESGGAFLTSAGTTTVNATGAITIAGGTCSAAGNLTLNGGQLTRDAAGALLIAPTRTLTVQAGGDAAFTGAFTGSAAQSIFVTGAGSMLTTLGGGNLQIRGDAALNVLAGGAVASTGQLNVGTGAGGGDGTVTVSSAASSLSVAGTTALGQNGNFAALTFADGSTGTLAGLNVGVSSVAGTEGRLRILSGAEVTATGMSIGSGTGVNTGAANLLGAGSSLTILGSGATTIGAAANAVGTLTIQSGATFTSGTGLVTVNPTGLLAVQAGGTLAGAADFAGTGPITLAGAFHPGTSSGVNRTTSVSFAQNIALQPTTSITVEIGGTVPGSGYDQLVFNGPGAPHFYRDGALHVALISGFAPQVGQVFNLFDFDLARSAGAFSSIYLPTLGPGRFWRTEQLYADGTLAVANAPSTYAEWQAAYGTGAWGTDDDGDGIANGIEFLLGTDPKKAFAAGAYPIQELPRLGLLARVTFDIPEFPAADAQYVVLSSPDLVTWTIIATKTGAGPWESTVAGVTVTSDPPIGGYVNIIVSETLPAATARRFHQLFGAEP